MSYTTNTSSRSRKSKKDIVLDGDNPEDFAEWETEIKIKIKSKLGTTGVEHHGGRHGYALRGGGHGRVQVEQGEGHRGGASSGGVTRGFAAGVGAGAAAAAAAAIAGGGRLLFGAAHVSEVRGCGRCCLPSKGETDW